MQNWFKLRVKERLAKQGLKSDYEERIEFKSISSPPLNYEDIARVAAQYLGQKLGEQILTEILGGIVAFGLTAYQISVGVMGQLKWEREKEVSELRSELKKQLVQERKRIVRLIEKEYSKLLSQEEPIITSAKHEIFNATEKLLEKLMAL